MDQYITVAELPEFVAFAKKHLSDYERAAIIDFIAENPTAGEVIEGTGGLRKFRWAVGNKGKSGGYRVIHYYYSDEMPVFLITAFAKKDMENISKAAKNEYRRILPLIVKAYKGGKND